MKHEYRRLGLAVRFSDGSKRYFFAAIVASLLMTLFNTVTPQIFKITVDSILGDAPFSLPEILQQWVDGMGGRTYFAVNLWAVAIFVVLVAALSGICNFLCRISTAKAGENFAKKMRDNLYEHVQRLPMAWQVKHQTGDIIQRCTSDVEVVRNFAVTQFLEVFRTVFLIGVSLFFMFGMNVKLSLIALAFVPIVAAYSGYFYHKISRNFLIADEAEGVLSTVVQENLTGVRVVRAFGREQFEIDRFTEKNNIFANLWIKLGLVTGLYWGVGDLITGLQVISIIVFGTMEAVNGQITMGEFIAFAAYNATLVWPIRGLGRILSDMSKAGVSFDRIDYILNAREEKDRPQVSKLPVEGEIVFEHVSFQYDGSQPILQDVSFSIQPGTTFAILGGTGSGKSTVVQLLNRLYELPQRGPGRITIGGRDIRDMELSWLRQNIGMVLQEPFLFSRTIQENIAAAVPGATLEDVRQAAKTACVDDAISGFPDGYDTLVGERGITLSGGQKQRVAIARMLLQNTPILVFDDSLSAVDSETDAQIRSALHENRGDATMILISHRVTTLMQADRILVLDEGRVAEIGTHRQLLEQNGIYKKIYDIQMNSDDRALTEGGNG